MQGTTAHVQAPSPTLPIQQRTSRLGARAASHSRKEEAHPSSVNRLTDLIVGRHLPDARDSTDCTALQFARTKTNDSAALEFARTNSTPRAFHRTSTSSSISTQRFFGRTNSTPREPRNFMGSFLEVQPAKAPSQTTVGSSMAAASGGQSPRQRMLVSQGVTLEANEDPEPSERSDDEEEDDFFQNPFASIAHISDPARPLGDARKSVVGPRTSSMKHAQRLFGLNSTEGRQAVQRTGRTETFTQRVRGAVKLLSQAREEPTKRRLSDDARKKLFKKERDMAMVRAIYNKARQIKAQDTDEVDKKKTAHRPSFFSPDRSEKKGLYSLKQVLQATRQIKMEQNVHNVLAAITGAADNLDKDQPSQHETQREQNTSTAQQENSGGDMAAAFLKRRSLVLKKAAGLVKELEKEVSEDTPSAKTQVPRRGGSELKTRLMRNVRHKKGNRDIVEMKRSVNALKNTMQMHLEAEEAFSRLKAIPMKMAGAKTNDIFIAQAIVQEIRSTVTRLEENLTDSKDCLNDVGIGKLPLCPHFHLMEFKAVPGAGAGSELCDSCFCFMGDEFSGEDAATSKSEYMWWCGKCTESYSICEKCGEARKADTAVEELYELIAGIGNWDLAFTQATTAILDAKAEAKAEVAAIEAQQKAAEELRRAKAAAEEKLREEMLAASRKNVRSFKRSATTRTDQEHVGAKAFQRSATAFGTSASWSLKSPPSGCAVEEAPEDMKAGQPEEEHVRTSPRNSLTASRSSIESSCTGTLNSSVDHVRFLPAAPDAALQISGSAKQPALPDTVVRRRKEVIDPQPQTVEPLQPVLLSLASCLTTRSAPVSRNASPNGTRTGSPSSRGFYLRHVIGYNRQFQKPFASAPQDAQHPGLFEHVKSPGQKTLAELSMLECVTVEETAASLDTEVHDNTEPKQQQQEYMASQAANEVDAPAGTPDSLDQHGKRDEYNQQHAMLHVDVFEVLRKTQGQAQPRRLLERGDCNGPEALGTTCPDLLIEVKGSNVFHGRADIEARETGPDTSCSVVQDGQISIASAPTQWTSSHRNEHFRTNVSAETDFDSADEDLSDCIYELFHRIHSGPTNVGSQNGCSWKCGQKVVNRGNAQASLGLIDGGSQQQQLLSSTRNRPSSTPPVADIYMRNRMPRPQRPKSSCDIEDVCCERWQVSLKPPRKALPFEKQVGDSRRVRLRAAAQRRSASVEQAEATARRLMPHLTEELQDVVKTDEDLEATMRPKFQNAEEQNELSHQHSIQEHTRQANSRMSSHTPIAIDEAQALVQHLVLPNLLRKTTPGTAKVGGITTGIVQAAGLSPSPPSHTPLLAQGLMDLQVWHATAAAWGMHMVKRIQGIQQVDDTADTDESLQAQHESQQALEAKGPETLHEAVMQDGAFMSTAPPPRSFTATGKSSELQQVVDGEILALDLEVTAADIAASSCASHVSTVYSSPSCRMADVVSNAVYPAPSQEVDEGSAPEDASQAYISSSGCDYSTVVHNGVAVLCRNAHAVSGDAAGSKDADEIPDTGENFRTHDELEPANADMTNFPVDKDDVLVADLDVALTDIGINYDTDMLTNILGAVTKGCTANDAGQDAAILVSEFDVQDDLPDVNASWQLKGVPEPSRRNLKQADVPHWAAVSPICLPTPCGRRPRTGDHWNAQQREDKKYLRCFAHVADGFKTGRVPWYQKDSVLDAPLKTLEVKPAPPPGRGGRRSRGLTVRPFSIEQWEHSFQRYDQLVDVPPL